MFKKGTKMYSILKCKCPRCQEGEFFKYKFTYNPKKVTVLHKNCPKCNLKYMIEPSFFYGAMYVGYALTVAICIASFVIFTLILGFSLLATFAAICIVIAICIPINLRLSRVLWIHMFIDPEEQKEKKVS